MDKNITVFIGTYGGGGWIEGIDTRYRIGEMTLFAGADGAEMENVLRLTDMRVLLAEKKNGWYTVREFAYEELSQAKYVPGGGGRRCCVRAALADGRLLEISAIDRGCGHTVARILTDRIRKARLHTYEERI